MYGMRENFIYLISALCLSFLCSSNSVSASLNRKVSCLFGDPLIDKIISFYFPDVWCIFDFSRLILNWISIMQLSMFQSSLSLTFFNNLDIPKKAMPDTVPPSMAVLTHLGIKPGLLSVLSGVSISPFQFLTFLLIPVFGMLEAFLFLVHLKS